MVRLLKRVLVGVVIWSLYRAKRHVWEIKGDNFNISYSLLPRYYSPAFWCVHLCTLVTSVFTVGILNWARHLSDPFEEESGFEGSFHPHIPAWKRKLALFILVYG